MALKIYTQPVFVPAYEVGRVTWLTGDGVNDTFDIQFGTSVNAADTVQVDLEYFARYLGGLSFPTTTTFQVSEVPAQNSQIVLPSNSYVLQSAYDQVFIEGAPDPANVSDVTFYVAEDGTGLTTNIYDSLPGEPGIGILLSNLVTAAGAQLSWCQLACADASGNVLTYQATGTTLYTAKYGGFTQLASACNPLATTLLTTSASSTLFVPGDYIRLNPGGGNQEDVRITAKSTNTLTISGTNFAHVAGENVFMVGRQFYWRITLPPDVLEGDPASFINLAIAVENSVESRL